MNLPVDVNERRRNEQLDRTTLAQLQLVKLNKLLAVAIAENRFYREKLGPLKLPIESLDQLQSIPYTEKAELIDATHDDLGPANLTWPIERYVHYHQTSGTHGRPMAVLDTAEDWQWWIDCWQYVLDAADIQQSDRALLAFSFGPFIGFWSAYSALEARGVLAIPGGGMSTRARLNLLLRNHATVVLATPTYACRMAEVAEEEGIALRDSAVRRIIVAGEPGGSIASVRQRIESAWEATVIDHAGASEVGAWGYADPERRGIHILETEFLAEFEAIEGGAAASDGQLSQLVLTSLGRLGMPVIRYRTGDLVRPRFASDDTGFVLLEGGVLGRADDMLVIRGVNIFPSAVEQILRSFPEVVEYRMIAYRAGSMDALKIDLEDRLEDPDRIVRALEVRLGLRVDVQLTPVGTLPRFEGKARRFIDERRG